LKRSGIKEIGFIKKLRDLGDFMKKTRSRKITAKTIKYTIKKIVLDIFSEYEVRKNTNPAMLRNINADKLMAF